MTLDAYLLSIQQTTREFAQIIEIPFHTVTKWRQRQRIPRRDAMSKIMKATNGKVKYSDWYYPKP